MRLTNSVARLRSSNRNDEHGLARDCRLSRIIDFINYPAKLGKVGRLTVMISGFDPSQDLIDTVQGFNRFYTRQIGLLDESLLTSAFSLTERARFTNWRTATA